MTEVVYVGAYQEGVDVPLPSGAQKHCAHGESIDVPDLLAKSLLEQEENWARPKPKHHTKEKD